MQILACWPEFSTEESPRSEQLVRLPAQSLRCDKEENLFNSLFFSKAVPQKYEHAFVQSSPGCL